MANLKLFPPVIAFFFFLLSIFPSTFSQPHSIGSPDAALLSPTMIPSPSPPPPRSLNDKTAVTVIGATAATTLVFAGIFFVFFQKCTARFRRRNQIESRQNFHGQKTEVAVKGLIVDDNGADVVYWRNLQMVHNFSPVLIDIPVLGCLSVEFSNVKKAAAIDYDSFITACSSLKSRVVETQRLVIQCGNAESGGFVKEMKGFLEECEEELKVVKEEQIKVMEVVKRTTEYYQAGSSKDNKPLQLFVIVKDFLDKADQVGIEINRKLEKENISRRGSSSSSTTSPHLSPFTRNDRLLSWESYSTPDNTSRTTYSGNSEDDF